MTERIWRAIFLTASGAVAVVSIVVSFFLFDGSNERLREDMAGQLELAAAGVERNGEEYLRDIKNYDRRSRLTWIGRDGIVLYDSLTASDNLDNHGNRAEVQEARSSDNGFGYARRDSSTMMTEGVYMAKRLADGTVLRISYRSETIYALLVKLLQPMYIVLGVLLLATYGIATKMAKDILQPVNELNLDDLPKPETETVPVYSELLPLIKRISSQRSQELAMQKRRREFTANVSHELKTPVQTIMAGAELLEQGMVRREDVPLFAGRIRSEAKHLVELISDIIHLSHIEEATEETLKKEPVDLRQTAEETVGRLRQVAQNAGVELLMASKPMRLGQRASAEQSSDSESVMVDGVPQLVADIVYNLTENAIKYSRTEDGFVVLSVYDDKERVCLEVCDNGIGIPAEHIDRIFERFYRVDSSHSRGIKNGADGKVKSVCGTGLGLAIVRHAADFHGAQLEVESRVSEGTIMRVKFARSA